MEEGKKKRKEKTKEVREIGRYQVEYVLKGALMVAQLVKNPSAVWEFLVWFLGWEETLEREWETHSSILAWKLTWTGILMGYSPWGVKGLDMAWWLNHHHHHHVF